MVKGIPRLVSSAYFLSAGIWAAYLLVFGSENGFLEVAASSFVFVASMLAIGASAGMAGSIARMAFGNSKAPKQAVAALAIAASAAPLLAIAALVAIAGWQMQIGLPALYLVFAYVAGAFSTLPKGGMEGKAGLFFKEWNASAFSNLMDLLLHATIGLIMLINFFNIKEKPTDGKKPDAAWKAFLAARFAAGAAAILLIISRAISGPKHSSMWIIYALCLGLSVGYFYLAKHELGAMQQE